ncbi:MAG: LysR family transcriptional regulator [Gammaproteobacteria bacterium]|nr:LysR family transcriptional regulator [Gammaproteobacteria bacterium]
MMPFTLQQLRLFESVARNNSFTRAAKELALSQPAVSSQMKRLEQELGVAVFEQVGKKIFLTPAGMALYDSSGNILAHVAELKENIDSFKGVIQGPLQIAVITTSKYFMPHLLGEFLKKYPDVKPTLKFTNRAAVMARLMNNEDDFVVLGLPPDNPNLKSYQFLQNVLVAVAPPDHPMAQKKNIPLRDFIGEKSLVREPGSGTRMVFENEVVRQKLTLDPYMELDSSEAIKQSVMAGLGLSVLSLHSIRLEIKAGALVVLDVKGMPLRQQWYAIHLKGKRPSLAARTFLDFILSIDQTFLEDDVLPS